MDRRASFVVDEGRGPAAPGSAERPSQGVEDGAHALEGAELPEADVPQGRARLAEAVRQVERLVGVGADGEDPAAQLVVQLQDPP